MKPMGLTDPRTGRRPYAAVQLRQENLRADSYNLVGFQNHLRFAEQKRIMRLIPGLENAEFLRYGQIHRNTYINAPALLDAHAAAARASEHFFRRSDFGRGRICGIDCDRAGGGYDSRRRMRAAKQSRPFPRETAIGSLCHYISHADPRHYQPANIAFDLFPPLDPNPRDRKERQTAVCRLALEKLDEYVARACLSWRRPSKIFSASGRGATIPRTLCATTARICASSSNTFRRRAPSRRRSPAIDLLSLREWLAHLYDRDQKPATIRRKLASLRSLFRFLSREHRIERDPARLLRLPKMPKTLPDVPNTEVTNALVDGTSREDLERPFPARDRLLLELLYGCGLRISEAVGLNLEDFDRGERWVRVRGKGRKETAGAVRVESGRGAGCCISEARQSRDGAAGALSESPGQSPDRSRRAQHREVLCDVCWRAILPSIRILCATRSRRILLSHGADLRAIQELLGHARLSTTQKYTQVSLTDLMRVYDNAHPKAKR